MASTVAIGLYLDTDVVVFLSPSPLYRDCGHPQTPAVMETTSKITLLLHVCNKKKVSRMASYEQLAEENIRWRTETDEHKQRLRVEAQQQVEISRLHESLFVSCSG